MNIKKTVSQKTQKGDEMHKEVFAANLYMVELIKSKICCDRPARAKEASQDPLITLGLRLRKN